MAATGGLLSVADHASSGLVPCLLQITEDNVIKILEDLESQTKAAAGVKKVTITRRKRDDEEEDDDDDF